MSDFENRIGTVRYTMELLHDWKEMLPVFARLVVVQSDYDFYLDTTKLTAFSPDFDIVPDGTIPPQYQCILTRVEGEPLQVRFERVEP